MVSLEQRVRSRAYLFLSDEVAGCAGMTLFELQRFLSSGYWPTERQLQQLARRMRIAP
jgi:hypothetical protein